MEESISRRRPQGEQNAEGFAAETSTTMLPKVPSAAMPLSGAQLHPQTSFAEGIL